MEILKKVIPLKIKFLRPNHPNFETKEVKKSYYFKNQNKKSVFKEEDFRGRNQV